MKQKKNTGIPFEKKVAGIYEQILALDGPKLKNLRVEHNVKLDSIAARKKDGTPRKRQIDVYWEFEAGGTIIRVCIQAKDWTRRISLGQVGAFRSVLDDIAGQPKGIMITSNGYQAGALDYARARGIDLLVLEPTDAGNKSIKVNFAGYNIRPTKFQIFADEGWNRANGFTPECKIQVQVTTDMPFFLEDGSLWGTLADAINQAIPRPNKIGTFSGNCNFHRATFINTGNPELPRYKLERVWAEGELTYFIQPVEVRRVVSEVLRSVLKDQKYLVDDFGKLVSETEPFAASGDVQFPDGHTMKLSIVNIGHLSEEAKKEYRESMERLADDINSGKVPSTITAVEPQSADHQ